MTKQEFLDYVAGFNKEPGNYTEDEIYAICTRFSEEVPLGERSWDELQGILGTIGRNGLPRRGEGLRTYFKAKRYEKGEVVHNERLLSGQTVDGLTFPEFEEKATDIKRDLYIQEIKTRDERNSYRRTLRDEARIDKIKTLIADSIKHLCNLQPIEYDTGCDCDDVEAVMLLSDMHLGMQIDNFANRYNSEIARKRLMAYVDETIRICQESGVSKLNVCNLGDMIHGIIHITARLEEEEDVIEQIMLAAEILAEALNRLQEAAPIIIYRSVTDNHSRAIANFKEHVEKENLARLIDFYLEARLKDTNIVFGKDNLDWDISKFELLNGKIMVCSHGHRDSINTILQGYMGATREYIDYVCVGHYHESKMKSFQGAKVFVNGSLCGTDSYAQSRRLFGDPEQTLLVFRGNTLSQHLVNLKDVK